MSRRIEPSAYDFTLQVSTTISTGKIRRVATDTMPLSPNHTSNPLQAFSSEPNLHQSMDTQLEKKSDDLDFVSQRHKRRRSSVADYPTGNDELKELMLQFMSAQTARLENYDKLSSRLDVLEKHILEIKNSTVKIESTNQDIEKSVNFMSDQVTYLESKIACMDKERSQLVSQFSSMQNKLDNLDRQSLRTTIEIRNVPKQEREDKKSLFKLIHNLSKTINLELSNYDIRDVSRQLSKRDSKVSALNIEFSNTMIKYSFLQAAKDYNRKFPATKLNSTNLGLLGETIPIFIAEQLTPATKQLFYNTRLFAKQHSYDYSWTSEGRVLLRKNSSAPYIVVKSEAQLQEMAKSTLK